MGRNDAEPSPRPWVRGGALGGCVTPVSNIGSGYSSRTRARLGPIERIGIAGCDNSGRKRHDCHKGSWSICELLLRAAP